MGKELSDIRITLFFTSGLSMKTWSDLGMLDREMAIYGRLAKKCREVNIITYGEEKDKHFERDFPGINILPARWRENPNRLAGNVLLKYFLRIYRSDVLKTNQILGSEVPIWLKKMLGKKLVVRCGYLFSYMTRKQTDDESIIESAVNLERNAFEHADMGIVTSAWQREVVIDTYNVDPQKIKVIPNYVVTEIFTPDPTAQKKFDLVFVGRSGEQKNIPSLLAALRFLKGKKERLSLLMVGSCCDDNEIREEVKRDGLDVTFMGSVPNFKLPVLLNQARVFILPSLYEGHPKVLLEAMSCGLPCIGSDVDGIRQEIEHGETGFLSETDPASIANAVESVLSDELLQRSLGEKARNHVLGNYSLDRVYKMELDVLREVTGK